jgi:hypothetical protein
MMSRLQRIEELFHEKKKFLKIYRNQEMMVKKHFTENGALI